MAKEQKAIDMDPLQALIRLKHRQKGEHFMNYGKNGVRARQKALTSKSAKWGRKAALTLLKVFLIAIVGLCIIGAATGIGIFKGVIATAPSVEISALVPKGQASQVYDNAGNEIDRFVGSNANRTNVTLDQVPKHLGQAFVAIEDERFYQHNGIDIKGLFRAAYTYVKSGFRQTQGASTITQQLLKNAVFLDWTSEGDNYIKKIKRKIQEQYLAIEVTKNTDKDMVLLAYMNTINCGQNTLGVQAASLRYFNKDVSDLTLSECAVIASITQNPTGYNPISNPENNKRRRKDCLERMKRLEFITQAEYDEAIADTDAVYQRIQTANAEYVASTNYKGTYFTDALQKQVISDLVSLNGYSESVATNLVMSGGLQIYSTLDSNIQKIVDEEFSNPDNFPANVYWQLEYALTVYHKDGTHDNYSKENMVTWFKRNGNTSFDLLFSSQEEGDQVIAEYEAAMASASGDEIAHTITYTAQPQASIVIIDQDTGYVAAMLGGRGNKEGRLTLNRATDTVRQPGSTYKVVSTYAPALDSAGMTLATVFNDYPFNYDDGTPVNNYDRKFDYRTISIREAIMRSKNIIAVKTLTQITPQLGYDYLLNFGFTTLVNGLERNGQVFYDARQPLALGGITNGVKNIELCGAYASIANMGAYNEPKLYSRVLDSEGNVLLDNTSPVSRQVIKPTTAYLLTLAMQDVVTGGTGKSVNFGGMSIAGKTGTTSNNQDVWFAGFTPYYTCTTWVGYDNNQELNKLNKGETSLARNLWKAVMQRIHAELPQESFMKPDGIVAATVCADSGKLPIEGICTNLKTEYFADGTVPTESCDMHYQGNICQYDGLPAAPECPFQVPGTCSLPHVEDESLWNGSTVLNADGTVTQPQTTTLCQHDAAFFADPNYQAILDQQQAELNQRAAAAQQEAYEQQGEE